VFRTVVVVIGWLVLVGSAQADVQTKKIAYKHGDLECQGYLAWDDAVPGPRPGVLVVHEWWGLNDYARGRAEQLAKLGYVAFAAGPTTSSFPTKRSSHFAMLSTKRA